ncbi:MAG: AAA family ATPase, partial [Candidatus Pacebacteria bacterium]|nr:AAA family ATPase [Candidatus Paceibacterota bacterium]
MRAGKPVIIDEVNKADSGVVAILNSLLETGKLTLPNGDVVKAEPGFVIIALMNPPIPGMYEVEPLSGEFPRRFSTHKLDYLPAEQEFEILDDLAKHRVNEKYLRRLIKAARKLRKLYTKEGAIPAPPALRPLKRTVVRIRDYGDKLVFGAKQRRDKQIFEYFEQNFLFDELQHRDRVKEVFKDAEVALLPEEPFSQNPKDAIDELLDGEPLVERGKVEIEPDTDDPKINKILKVLQLNFDANVAREKIKALDEIIDSYIAAWGKENFAAHLNTALRFKRVVEITTAIKGMAHTRLNKKALETLEQKMEKHLLSYGWPDTFFVEEFDVDKELLQVIPTTDELLTNELLSLIQIFRDEPTFVQETINKISEKIDDQEKQIAAKNQQADESINGLRSMYALYKNLEQLLKQKVLIKDISVLKEKLEKAFEQGPLSIKDIEKTDRDFKGPEFSAFNAEFVPAGADVLKTISKMLDSKSQKEAFINAAEKHIESFSRLYRAIIVQAIQTQDETDRENCIKIAKQMYPFFYQPIKSLENKEEEVSRVQADIPEELAIKKSETRAPKGEPALSEDELIESIKFSAETCRRTKGENATHWKTRRMIIIRLSKLDKLAGISID